MQTIEQGSNRTGSRARNQSSQKGRLDVQLPKISRTVFCNGSFNNNSLSLHKPNAKENMIPPSAPSISYVQKIKWVVEDIDYGNFSDDHINKQHRRLKKQLMLLNQEVNRAVSKLANSSNLINLKRQRKSLEYDSAKNLVVRQKEVQNNQNILDRYRKEFQMLKKKTEKLGNMTKDDIQQQIQQTLILIGETKGKIKQLKAKNKQIQNMIMNPDVLITQMKRLSQDLQLIEHRKIKIERKKEASDQQIGRSQQKLTIIQDDYQIAQNYFAEHYQQEIMQGQNTQLEREINKKKVQLQITRKKVESVSQTKQQRYHHQLKRLEDCINKARHTSGRIHDIEIEINNSKNLIKNLSEQLEEWNLRIGEQSESQKIEQQIDFDKQSQVLNQFMTQILSVQGNTAIKNRQELQQQIDKQDADYNQQMQKSQIKQIVTLDIDQIYEQSKQQLSFRTNHHQKNEADLKKQTERTFSDNLIQKQPFNKSLKIEEKSQNRKKKENLKIINFQQIKQQFVNHEDQINDNQTEIKQQTEFDGEQLSANQSRTQNDQSVSSFTMKKQHRLSKPIDRELNKFRNQLSQIQGKLAEKRKYKIDVQLATVRESIQIAHKTKFGKSSKEFDQFFNNE